MAVDHPKFNRPNYKRSSRSRVKDEWRKPRGIDNKQRTRVRYMPEMPSIGWRGKKTERDIHPSGLKEVLVHNVSEVQALKGNKIAVRISASVSKRKKGDMVKAAQKLELKVLN
jgi:large subunit ribosomal protein L32e